jgi:hypothetical protein
MGSSGKRMDSVENIYKSELTKEGRRRTGGNTEKCRKERIYWRMNLISFIMIYQRAEIWDGF